MSSKDFADAISNEQPNRNELDSRDIEDVIKKFGSTRKGDVDIRGFTDELKRVTK